MIRKAVAILLLGVFGGFKLPVENALDQEQKAADLRKTVLNLNLREQVGQMGFLAALSGFRSPLAAILWIDAHNAWERTEWGRMASLFGTVTTLQPHSNFYWDMAAWHMAYNASVAAQRDEKQPNEAIRQRNEQQYIKLGEQILENGVRNNPQSGFLHERLATLLRDKSGDHCKAGEEFLLASQLPDTLPYVARMAGYELSQCPGREREAYELLRKSYDKGPSERKPNLIRILKELEKKLDVPADQRISSDPRIDTDRH